MAAGAHVALAELEEKAGNEDKALDHLLVARLSGRMPKHGTPLLERLYAKAPRIHEFARKHVGHPLPRSAFLYLCT